MKFTVISDIHYRSRKFLEFEEHKAPEPDAFLATAASEKGLMLAASAEYPDIILITGDITDRGDRQSHEDVIEILRKIKASGKRVYAITATHDYCHHKAYIRKPHDTEVRYKTEPWSKPFFDKDDCEYKKLVTDEFSHLSEEECRPCLADVCKYEELKELYYEFGPSEAVSVFDDGHSYCVELDENVWCLMLEDSFRNVENMPDISPLYSPMCLEWIDSMIKRAKSEGKFIFACSHHPFVPSSPGYRVGSDNKNMRCPEVGHTLADMGIPLVFSGHSHFSDISFAKSDKGNLLCDITTPSLFTIPPRFRVVDLDAENHTVDIKSVEITEVEGYNIPEGLPEYRNKAFVDGFRQKVAALPAPLNKVVAEMKVGTLCPLVKRAGKLTKDDINSIKDRPIFDLLMELVINLQVGDGKYTPDTPEYKFMMGLSTFVDSIIERQPFYDVRKKIFKGYTVKEMIEPLLCNKYLDYANVKFDFTKEPKPLFEQWSSESHAGDIIVAMLCVAAAVLSPLAAIGTAFAIPVMTVRKAVKEKKDPTLPDRYY